MAKSESSSHELLAVVVKCNNKSVPIRLQDIQFGESMIEGPMVSFQCPNCGEYKFVSLIYGAQLSDDYSE